MALYNTLSWQNANGLSSYPLAFDIEPQNFIVDAKFVQFDGYIPSLTSIKVQPASIILTIAFDYGVHENCVYTKDRYDAGDESRQLQLYTPDNSRWLGVLTFGPGAGELWNNYTGRNLQVNVDFLSSTVVSIPSQDAVYTLDGNYGNITLSRTAEDSTVFYNASAELNGLVFNAVTGHAIGTQVQGGVKKINHVSPLNNNINLAPNDVIKVKPSNSASLTVELVSGSPSGSFTIPTLTV